MLTLQELYGVKIHLCQQVVLIPMDVLLLSHCIFLLFYERFKFKDTGKAELRGKQPESYLQMLSILPKATFSLTSFVFKFLSSVSNLYT